MNQEEKSKRSREQILHAALDLFSRCGYRATSVRDIAQAARLSTGNVYHHFPDKESIFLALLDEYWQAIDDPDLPFNRALATDTFPENLEDIARAARETIKRHRKHITLIYVDVVEFEGRHIQKFYSEMSARFARFLARSGGDIQMKRRLRHGISPLSAVMLASRFLLQYFAVEIVFGVPDQFGKDTDEVIREFAEILRHGMLRPEVTRASGGTLEAVAGAKR
ncbi:MAG: TetR/AcrR family transcriptional regulator [Acidobacteria bacterium]|nr:TetR/AcrR family transcriptional regulator [Acidobacteriota bacterium]